MAIEVDGKIYRNLPEQVEENANQIEDIKTWLSTLGAVMHYKGSVATYDDLPTEDNEIGDVWNVIDTGNNYAWDGEGWDEIGSAVDISNLVTLDTDQTITGKKTFNNDVHIGANKKLYLDSDNPYLFGTFTFANGAIESNNTIIPSVNNLRDLGKSSANWKDLYLGGNVYIGSTGKINTDVNGRLVFYYNNNSRMSIGNTNTVIYNNFEPNANNTCDLGRSAVAWKDLYLSGTIYASSLDFASNFSQVKIAGNNRYMFGNSEFIPNGSQQNLGHPSYKWQDLYLARNLTDGTNSVTVAQLAGSVIKTLDSTAINSAWSTTTLVTGFYKNEASLSTTAYNALKDAKSIFIKMSDNGIYPATFDYLYYKIKVIGDVDFSGGSLTEVEIYYQ